MSRVLEKSDLFKIISGLRRRFGDGYVPLSVVAKECECNCNDQVFLGHIYQLRADGSIECAGGYLTPDALRFSAKNSDLD